MYCGRERATAVNYFTGSSLFNRALRYWCAFPPPSVVEVAAKTLPGGDRFHLSDHELTVRAGRATGDAETVFESGMCWPLLVVAAVHRLMPLPRLSCQHLRGWPAW